MRAMLIIAAAAMFGTMSVTATRPQAVRQRDAKWVAPAGQDGRPNPLANRPDTAAGGNKVFHQRCVTCHGEDARGTGFGPDLTSPEVQSQSDGALFWKITNGNPRTGMPTFSFLPEPQRWQLVTHVRAHAGR